MVHAPEDAYIRSERTHWARIFFQNALGPYSFIVFIFIVLGFGVFFFLKLPETKNRKVASKADRKAQEKHLWVKWKKCAAS